MLLLKMPKLVRIIKKTKIRWYNKGWKECEQEKDTQVDMAKANKIKEIKEIRNEMEELKVIHKKKLEEIKREFDIEKETDRALTKKRIDEIRQTAEEEITNASEREREYYTLVTKLRTLFHEGAVKFLITAEEQESLMASMATTVHRKNEFIKLSEEFDKLMKENIKTVNSSKLKQIADR